jgi:digeranylgeranylglycerophospholipid reductase
VIDVIVVGGGPAGCRTAALLAQKGFEVALFEEHPTIGEPVDCTGIVGAETFAKFSVPEELKLGEIRSIRIVSPGGLEVRLPFNSPLAYIIDRGRLDRSLAERAKAAGVSIRLRARVRDLEVRSDGVEVSVSNAGEDCRHRSETEKIKAAMVVLAGGPRYRLQSKLGLGCPANFLKTAQVEVPTDGLEEARVFVGSKVAPGSFGWAVPYRKHGQEHSRIGISARMAGLPYLKSLLGELRAKGYLHSSDGIIRSWVIPISPLRRTYADRVLAVGDAAGQAKATTGGGIFYCFNCADTAAEVVTLAFAKSDFSADFLATYEKKWQKTLGREMQIGAFFRRVAEGLDDRQIDEILHTVKSDGILSSIQDHFQFDWHQNIIRFALRHASLGRLLRKSCWDGLWKAPNWICRGVKSGWHSLTESDHEAGQIS